MPFTPPDIRLPSSRHSPLWRLSARLAAALGLVVFVTMLAYLDRDEYRDAADSEVSLLDCFYYATVSISTTGYGDITPVSDSARLMTSLLTTPARILFLIILVGTTVEVLATRTRKLWREKAWRRTLHDHTIVCGFGTKGRAAVETLLARDHPASSIVVVDSRSDAVDDANRSGFGVVHGDAGRASVLEAAGVRDASAVIVAAERDDASVLITLTARELNPGVPISAAAREEENVHLLKQSGANAVILSSGAAGRLLGQSVDTPNVVAVLEDLISVGRGLDLTERTIGREDAGPIADHHARAPVIGLVRGSEFLRFDEDRAKVLQVGDRVICLCSND